MERYSRLKILGSGTFGKAHLVRRLVDKQLFVMKEVNLARMNPREREEARNECKVLQLLIHPNVIRYEEHFEKRNVLYIIMEYADGGDLHQKVMNQRNNLMREETVLHYFVQMCLALDYLHSRHILHRDIKAMNIFLTSNGTVKLGDFGISTILRNTMGMANTVCGTPYYFSPELCKNKPYNNKTDVWALGVVLFEMLSLKHPFDASNLNQLMQRILKSPTPGVPSIYSPHVREIVFWCLEKEHQKRPSVRALLQKDITKRALVRLQGDLGQAAGTNQRLQQVVAERVAESAAVSGAAAAAAVPAPTAAAQQQQARAQQQEKEKAAAAAKAQQQAKAQREAEEARAAAARRNPSPQPRVSPQQHALPNPVVAVHGHRDQRIGGAAVQQPQQQQPPSNQPTPRDPFRPPPPPVVNVNDQRGRGAHNVSPVPNPIQAGAAAGGLNRNNNIQQQAPPPPPKQHHQHHQHNQNPPRSLADRMAEMERNRNARIQQLERERREAEERERKDIEEARRLAQARVAANRQKRHEAVEAQAAREKEDRERRRAKRLPSVPASDAPMSGPQSGAAHKKPVEQQQQQHPAAARAAAAGGGGVAGALGFGGGAGGHHHQQQQQPRRASPQPVIPISQPQHPVSGRVVDERPAISNQYLAHLRDHQANRQAAGGWVEQQQQRRLSGQAGVPLLPGQQPPAQQRLDRDVEKWLADEQKKRWDGGVAGKVGQRPDAESARQQQQQQQPPRIQLQPLPGAAAPRPMTPPPSPSQALRGGPRRKHGAVEPLEDKQQQQQQGRRGSNPDLIGGGGGGGAPPARKLALDEAGRNNKQPDVIEFAKKLEAAKRGEAQPVPPGGKPVAGAPRPLDAQIFGGQRQQQQQQQQQQNDQFLRPRRDHSAPPVLSPMRIAPCNITPCASAEELVGDTSCELVPVRSSDNMGSGALECNDSLSDADSVEALEAHEALLVEQEEVEERRIREYTAMSWHIRSVLDAPPKQQKQQQQQNERQESENFQEDPRLDDETTDDSVDSDEEEDMNSSDSGMLDAQTDFVKDDGLGGKNKLRPPPDAQAETNPPHLKQQQQQQQKPLNNNRNGNVISNHQHNNNQNRPTFPLLHLCGGVAFSRWWQSVENTAEEATALRAALIRRLKVKEVVSQVIQLLNMACTSVNGSNGSLAVNMYKMVEPFVTQVRKVVKNHVSKTKLLGQVDEEVADSFVDEIVQTASRIVFFEGYTNMVSNNNAAAAAGAAVAAGAPPVAAAGGRR